MCDTPTSSEASFGAGSRDFGRDGAAPLPVSTAPLYLWDILRTQDMNNLDEEGWQREACYCASDPCCCGFVLTAAPAWNQVSDCLTLSGGVWVADERGEQASHAAVPQAGKNASLAR